MQNYNILSLSINRTNLFPQSFFFRAVYSIKFFDNIFIKTRLE